MAALSFRCFVVELPLEVRLALRPEGLAILEGIGVVTLADFANLVASPQELLESAILVAGGSPCQDVSSLKSSPPGLRSARTNLFRCVPEFARACEDIVEDLGKNIPVLAMLENVCNTPASFQEAAMKLISAGSFGWTARSRSFWCCCNGRSADSLLELRQPKGVQAERSTQGWRPWWQDKKPWPAHVAFADQFKPRFDPAKVAQSKEDLPCFPVFTRVFPRKPDRGNRQDLQAVERFVHDGSRLPLFNYQSKHSRTPVLDKDLLPRLQEARNKAQGSRLDLPPRPDARAQCAHGTA